MPTKVIIPNLQDYLRRYQSGESENALAKEIGVNRSTFRKRLLDAGIAPRNQSQSETLKWAKMSRTKRANQVRAAHAAARGRNVSFDELCQRAKSREGNLNYNVSADEIALGDWLKSNGVDDVVHNAAVGPYNCDIRTGSIIVEVWGGNWHPKPIDIERTKYILDSGYHVLIIDTQKRFPLDCSIIGEDIITCRYIFGLDPAGTREYWMIRGDGELIFARYNSDDISMIPPFTSSRNTANGQYMRVPR